MPSQRRNGPQTPEQIHDDLMRRLKKSQDEREAVAEFQEEERALAMAEDDQIVTTTATGKMIRRHGSKARGYSPHTESLRDVFGRDGYLGAIDKIAQTGIRLIADMIAPSASPASTSATDGISSHFKHKGSRFIDGLQPKHEDENYIYDAMFVSQPVHKKLMLEAETIAAKLAEMEAVKDNPALQKALAEALTKMADEFEMRIHPLTGVYVHDFQRVMREEKRLNGKQSLNCEFKVCVFLAKAELSDLRGIKAKIGDPYNDDPAEAIATGDHIKGHAPASTPSKAPAFDLT